MIEFRELQKHSFTQTYHQPEQYHFCLDSVIFGRYVADQVRERWPMLAPDFRALDVCAGCGIVGFEISHHLPDLENVDFMEIQETFRPYFDANLALMAKDGCPRNFTFVNSNFRSLSSATQRYDLIAGNPPYFFAGEGLLSPVELKNRARFFLDASLEELVAGVIHSLKPSGLAFLLIKPGRRHGRDTLGDLQVKFSSLATLEVSADIRGTHVLRISDCISEPSVAL